MKLDVDGKYYDIVIEKKSGNRNTYIRVKKDLTIQVTTNKFTSNKAIEKLIEEYKGIINDVTDENKKQVIEMHFLCDLFYKYVQNKKGDFALQISFEEWVQSPTYIMEGLEWLK